MTPLAIVGKLSFPPGAFEAWLAQPVRTDAFRDWPSVAPIFRGESAGAHATVKDLLAALHALSGSPAFFELDGEVAGFFLPDDTARLHQDLATALRQAASLGVTGDIAFVAVAEQVALSFTVGAVAAEAVVEEASDEDDEEEQSDDASDDDEEEENDDEAAEDAAPPSPGGPQWAPAQALFARDETAKAFVAVMEFVNAWQRDQALTRRAYRSAQETLGLAPLAEQPTHAKLLASVAAKVDEAHAAMVEAKVLDARDRPLADRYPTPASLATALAAAEPPARAAAVELLSLVDAAAAQPAAIELVGDGSRQVRRHAIRALGRIPTAAAFDALLALDPRKLTVDDTLAAVVVQEAVKASEWSGADARALALLGGPALRPAAWTALDRVKDREARAALLATAANAIALVAQRPGANPVSKLFALFDDHPAEEVRVEAAKALVLLRTADVQQRAEPLNLALHGMGKALNQDDARRRALLGIADEEDSGGILKFRGLTLATLETLLAERFIHPDARQNDAPSTSEFLGLMREHPQILAHGYAVSRKRSDYRVQLEGIDCDLKQVPDDRKDAVREVFEQLSETANEVELEGDDLSLWWT